ncbi:MAG: hypothetical protein HYZ27_06940, partial [Deltaproteobacteria bacterium]|nr:hypothetical protein [Deltaproteobacteria bacterium]
MRVPTDWTEEDFEVHALEYDCDLEDVGLMEGPLGFGTEGRVLPTPKHWLSARAVGGLFGAWSEAPEGLADIRNLAFDVPVSNVCFSLQPPTYAELPESSGSRVEFVAPIGSGSALIGTSRRQLFAVSPEGAELVSPIPES